jgi:hypothetical protein
MRKLGYLPVLAEPAAEITSWRGNRKTGRARQEMIKGFLLYRVYVCRHKPAVSMRIEPAVDVLPDRAKTKPSLLYPAVVSAKVTIDLLILKLLVE